MADIVSTHDFVAMHDYICTKATITDKATDSVTEYTLPEPYHIVGGHKYLFNLFDDLSASIEDVTPVEGSLSVVGKA